jgi:hypothetical protein
MDGEYYKEQQKITFGGEKAKISLHSPKTKFWTQKRIWSCNIFIDRNFDMEDEKIYDENMPSEPKNGIWGAFRAQKQNMGPKEKYTFGGR